MGKQASCLICLHLSKHIPCFQNLNIIIEYFLDENYPSFPIARPCLKRHDVSEYCFLGFHGDPNSKYIYYMN